MPTHGRNAVLAGLAFGIAFGAFMGFRSGNLILGAVSGLAGGVLFGVAIGAFVRRQTENFTAQDPTAPGERLLKQGPANRLLRGESVGGFLYLTDSRLLFRSHTYNVQVHEWSIPLAGIRDVQPSMTAVVIPNGLRLVTTDGEERFVVDDRKGWAKAILAATRR